MTGAGRVLGPPTEALRRGRRRQRPQQQVPHLQHRQVRCCLSFRGDLLDSCFCKLVRSSVLLGHWCSMGHSQCCSSAACWCGAQGSTSPTPSSGSGRRRSVEIPSLRLGGSSGGSGGNEPRSGGAEASTAQSVAPAEPAPAGREQLPGFKEPLPAPSATTPRIVSANRGIWRHLRPRVRSCPPMWSVSTHSMQSCTV